MKSPNGSAAYQNSPMPPCVASTPGFAVEGEVAGAVVIPAALVEAAVTPPAEQGSEVVFDHERRSVHVARCLDPHARLLFSDHDRRLCDVGRRVGPPRHEAVEPESGGGQAGQHRKHPHTAHLSLPGFHSPRATAGMKLSRFGGGKATVRSCSALM